MRQYFGAVTLRKIKWFDHSLCLAFNDIHKWEVHCKIFSADLLTLISCSHLRIEKEFADIVFQQALLIFFCDKVALDVMVKQLQKLGLWIIGQYYTLVGKLQHRFSWAYRFGE